MYSEILLWQNKVHRLVTFRPKRRDLKIWAMYARAVRLHRDDEVDISELLSVSAPIRENNVIEVWPFFGKPGNNSQRQIPNLQRIKRLYDRSRCSTGVLNMHYFKSTVDCGTRAHWLKFLAESGGIV